MTVVTRFAPSPTGRLHVGNIRTALHNACSRGSTAGTFLLRIDDTDRERSTAEFDQAIRDDLDWLGLDAGRDGPPVGAVRPLRARVRAAAGRRAGSTPATRRPRSSTFAARCCSAAACRRSTSASPTDAPVPEGVAPHWRFRLDHDAPIEWNDLIRGPQRFDPKLLSDPVVRREDGSWLYLLPSVIDDIDLGVTHIVRGEDHVSNSAAQIQMFEALGAEPPAVRARGAAGRRRGQAVEAARLVRRRASARGGRRADGAAVAARPDRHVAAGRADGQPRRARRRLRLRAFRPRAGAFRPARRRAAQRPAAAPARLCRRSPTGCRPARPRRTGCCCAATSSAWPISRDWLAVLRGEIEPPELEPRRAAAGRARRPRSPTASTGPASRGRRSPSALKSGDRPKGPRAVPPAAPGADRPRERARNGRHCSAAWARTAPSRRLEAAAKR